MTTRAATWLKAYTWLVFVFLYAPILGLVVFSFNASKSQAVWKGFTWNWYVVALRNETILACIKHSVVVAAATTLIAITIGTLAGLALAKRFPGRGATGGLLSLPIVIPEIVLAVA